MTALAPTLQGVLHRTAGASATASPHTVAAYRDTLRLLLRLRRTNAPAKHLSARRRATSTQQLIAAFLDHLETERGNSASHPQRPAGRDPLAVRLRRVIGSFR